MEDESETRYFRLSSDNAGYQTYAVWRLRTGHWGEQWNVEAQAWVERSERFHPGPIYWLYVNPHDDLDHITKEQAGHFIAGLNRGKRPTMAEVKAMIEEGG